MVQWQDQYFAAEALGSKPSSTEINKHVIRNKLQLTYIRSIAPQYGRLKRTHISINRKQDKSISTRKILCNH